MGIGFLKNKKGQVSIEFILIILIILVYIYSVILPTVNISTKTAEDVTRLSQTKFAAQKLALTINQLEANKGDGKKTISLFVPKGASVTCDNVGLEIQFSATMSDLGIPPVVGCNKPVDEVICSGAIELLADTTIDCFQGEPTIDASGGNIFKKVSVTRGPAGISVVYAS